MPAAGGGGCPCEHCPAAAAPPPPHLFCCTPSKTHRRRRLIQSDKTSLPVTNRDGKRAQQLVCSLQPRRMGGFRLKGGASWESGGANAADCALLPGPPGGCGFHRLLSSTLLGYHLHPPPSTDGCRLSNTAGLRCHERHRHDYSPTLPPTKECCWRRAGADGELPSRCAQTSDVRLERAFSLGGRAAEGIIISELVRCLLSF